MALPECVHGRSHEAHAAVELARPVVHAAGLETADDLLQQLRRVVAVVPVHDRCSLRGHAAAQVEVDGADVIALLLLQLASFLLLLRGQQPLQVEILEVHDLGVVLPLGQPDGLVVLVQLLVHRQGLVELVVVQEDGLGALELLGEHGHLGLRHVVARAVAADLGSVLLDEPVHLVEVTALRDVAQDCIAALGDGQVEVLHRGVGQRSPHGLGLRRQRQLL
mmetsp:Transcript_4768/g.18020  ORF Transcript_4768/g.18020 Transcript_4768/m.18020 type:complete len:221 (-) Transcript_4768:2129-2791(-)